LALIIVSATPGHFWKTRQELATLKQLAGFSKNTRARPAHYMALAKTTINAYLFFARPCFNRPAP
jgi:hypothetical protein